jgi:hypothetical protein
MIKDADEIIIKDVRTAATSILIFTSFFPTPITKKQAPRIWPVGQPRGEGGAYQPGGVRRREPHQQDRG